MTRRSICAGAALAILMLGGLAAPLEAHDKKFHAAAAPIPIDPGGPFALIDQHGKPVTDRDFRGRHMLIFFGYASCPGICPTGCESLRLRGK